LGTSDIALLAQIVFNFKSSIDCCCTFDVP